MVVFVIIPGSVGDGFNILFTSLFFFVFEKKKKLKLKYTVLEQKST
jgi:hypothetical protein